MEINNDGALLAGVLRSRNVNISELCSKINVNRRTLYNWFKKEKLNPELICKIGIEIHYNFDKEFDLEFLQSGIHNLSHHNFPDPLVNQSVAYWQTKYESLLRTPVFLSKSELNKENL